MNLGNIKKEAFKHSAENASASGVPGDGWARSEDGRIACHAMPSQSSAGWVVKAIWYLDGKRISASKLVDLIKMQKRTEKKWSAMTDTEKQRAYNMAIQSGEVKDTFTGFNAQMSGGNSIFDSSTGQLIETGGKKCLEYGA